MQRYYVANGRHDINYIYTHAYTCLIKKENNVDIQVEVKWSPRVSIQSSSCFFI